MDILFIPLVSFIAAGLTLLSGFGLGTLLMPVVALFFPVDVAIAMTALVHLANNLFKLALLGWQARRAVVLRFGLPAVLAAFVGAWTLGWLSALPPIMDYTMAGYGFSITPVKLAVGCLILFALLLELSPALASLTFDSRLLPVGGCVSGFFGGLSGNQGAFRSMFLLKAGLTKEEFVATGVVLAVIVDLVRLPVYGLGFLNTNRELDIPLVVVACLAAFAGSWLGSRLLKRMTYRSLQVVVSTLLAVIAVGLIFGAL